jgi:hypothetical protein
MTYSDEKRLIEIVNHQANMESLWLLNPTMTEALLMSALRHLHAVIEGDTILAEIQKQYYWNVDSEL